MMQKSDKLKKTWIGSVLIVLLIVGSVSGWVLNGIDYAGMRQLNQSNSEYLEKAFKQSITTFGVLSALKVGLAIIEGTEVGVGVNVEVGDAVQAAYDYVDIAWRVVLLSSAVLLGTQYLIQLAGIADDWLLAGALLFLLLSMLIKHWLSSNHRIKKIVTEIGLALWTLMIACYLILPLAVGTGQLISRHITAGGIEESEAKLSHMQTVLFPEEAQQSKSKLWNKVSQIKNKIQQIGQILTQQTSQLIVWILKLIAGYIFDTLIFPLLLFGIFYWLMRRVLRIIFVG